MHNFSASIQEGKITTILGPSGCGKTTLLHTITGLITPSTGQIYLNNSLFFDAQTGAFLPPEKRHIGFVFQNHALWPYMTIHKNLEYPLKAKKIDDKKFGRSKNKENKNR